MSVLVANYQTATTGENPAPKHCVAAPDTSYVSFAHCEVLLVGTEDFVMLLELTKQSKINCYILFTD